MLLKSCLAIERWVKILNLNHAWCFFDSSTPSLLAVGGVIRFRVWIYWCREEGRRLCFNTRLMWRCASKIRCFHYRTMSMSGKLWTWNSLPLTTKIVSSPCLRLRILGTQSILLWSSGWTVNYTCLSLMTSERVNGKLIYFPMFRKCWVDGDSAIDINRLPFREIEVESGWMHFQIFLEVGMLTLEVSHVILL